MLKSNRVANISAKILFVVIVFFRDIDWHKIMVGCLGVGFVFLSGGCFSFFLLNFLKKRQRRRVRSPIFVKNANYEDIEL